MLTNQCTYCMQFLQTTNELHTCPELKINQAYCNIDGHLLLTLVETILKEDVTKYNPNDLEEENIHQAKITNRSLDNIVIVMPRLNRSIVYKLKNYKHRMNLFNRLRAKYHIDLKLLVNRATYEFLTNNDGFLKLLYTGIQEDGEYRYSEELNQRRGELGYI